MIFKPGDVIGGRFRVARPLGKGGVGIVYLVFDKVRGEEVALKVLKPELAKQNLALERFKREVRAVRKIDHQGVVPVYETGAIGGALFYTMECVRGESIHDIIKREGPFGLDRAIALMHAICEIMERIHEVGVHRDISSDNIMLQPDGRVRILDFGAALLSGEESQLTRTGLHLGKIFYSAPEQRENSRAVDHRADLYSLGMLFFEMLTGQVVIAREPVGKYRQDLPPDVDAFFERALAQQPIARFHSAAAMRMELDALTAPAK